MSEAGKKFRGGPRDGPFEGWTEGKDNETAFSDSSSGDFEINIHTPAPECKREVNALTEVCLASEVLADIWRHASSTGVEVAGILAGYHANGSTHVQVALPAHSSRASSTSVTITHQDWDYFHRVLQQQYPKRKIMGWYHSHPGHGIFLSREDIFVHNSFFRGMEQIALVVDPLQERLGLFSRQHGYLLPEKRVLVRGADAAKWEAIISRETWDQLPPSGDTGEVQAARSLWERVAQYYRELQEELSGEPPFTVDKIRLELHTRSGGVYWNRKMLIDQLEQWLTRERGMLAPTDLEIDIYPPGSAGRASGSGPSGEPITTLHLQGREMRVRLDSLVLRHLQACKREG